MNTTKSLYIVCFITGIINLLIAANLYFSNSIASGFSVGKYGNVSEGSISATGAGIIGCALIIVSVFVFFGYRKEKTENRRRWLEEELASWTKSRKRRK